MAHIETVGEPPFDAENLHEIEAFYSEVLGLVMASKPPGRYVFFRVGRASMLLIFTPQGHARRGCVSPHGTTGSEHVALGVQGD